MNKERTGWRDERISRKHREWGMEAPIIDIDFLVIELKYSIPKAIIEYKEKSAKTFTLNDWQYKALSNLSNKAELPLFNVRYYIDNKEIFKGIITPLNKIANKYLKKQTKMNELEYINFLYAIRDMEVPNDATTTYWANKGWYAE